MTDTAPELPRLSVNVDHVATLRQARGGNYPQPLDAALAAERAGAAGITVHLRSDRRHIQDADVALLRGQIGGKLNLEMAITEEMLAIAVDTLPDQVSLVPERPDEVTTEGGLDVVEHGPEIARAAAILADAGIATSVFVDPDRRQLEALARQAGKVTGFEINTDRYTRAADADEELAKIADAASFGAGAGLAVYAGHGLTTSNVAALAALPEVEEFNIGHYLVSRSVLVGMRQAVREMLAAIAAGSESTLL